MKKYLYLFTCLCFLAAKSFAQGSCPSPAKLIISPAMITNESGKGDAALLVDEQAIAGDPANGTGGSPTTTWFPGWNAADHPASVYIDLGSVKQLTSIYLRDVNSTGNFLVETGSPGSWTTLFIDGATNYLQWNSHNVAVSTRYLRFTRQEGGANISEVVLYGCSGDTQAPTVPAGLVVSSKTTTSVNLTWAASTDNVGVTGYEVYRNGVLQSTVTTNTASVTGLTASTSYLFKVRAKDAANNFSAFSSETSVTTDGANTAEGAINFQKWNGIPGTAISDLTSNPSFPNSPSLTSDLSLFESESNIDDNYGARIIGYITAPQTGTYYFWVAGDDNIQLWLSTNNTAANKVMIASHTSWTNAREWNKFPTQKSAGVNLAAGTKYYVEALLKEGTGGDNLAVGWRKPSDGAGTIPVEVIPGTVLSRFIPKDTQMPTAPTALNSTGKTSSSVTLSWTASTDNVGVAGYDVYNGTTKVNSSTITGTMYTVAGLTASTAYTFTVKARDAAANTSPASNAVTVTTDAFNSTIVQRIPITERMVTNEVGLRDERGDFTKLFDEQGNITTNAPTGRPVTHWRVGGDATYYPAGLIVDLGQEYDISNIYWFDGAPMAYNGVDIEVKGGKIGIESGSPFNWTLKYEQTLANDSAWHNNATTFRTRYLHIKKYSTATYMWQTYGPFTADAPLMEMVIYGKPVGTPPPPPTNQHTPLNLTVDKFMGGNSWWYGDTTTFSAVGHIRAYHDLVRSGSVNLTDPLNIEDYDAFYGRNLTANYEIYPCLQGSADGTVNKPTFGGNSLLPETYRVHADNMWQWAARYGRNTSINPNLMRVLHWQTKKVGLGYLKYMENWNEPNQWWNGSAAHFSPYEFAAMSSADYDGHLGAMGNTVGAKNADPTMKFVMGGLASADVDFVKTMKLWSDANRGGSFPADVLNFHHYTNNGQKGTSPEAGNLLPILEKVVEYRNFYLPGKEVWLSEFGWDVEGGSTQQAAIHTQWPNSGYTSEDLQAMWLVRGFLIGARAGLDRMHAYTIGDAGGYGQYATSGMVTYGGVKRKSWYFVSTMRQRLKGMVCVGEQASGNPNVMIYKFKNLTGNNGVYAIWCPTSNGTTINNYQLTMGANPTSAKKVTLTNGNASGVESTLTIAGNKVTVAVSENPVFVTVSSIDGAIPQNARLSEEQTDVKEGQENSFMVYPNPVNHKLTVTLKNSNSGVLQMFDLTGKLQMLKTLSSSHTQIDVSALPKGMYMLKVHSGTSSDYTKIIVQ